MASSEDEEFEFAAAAEREKNRVLARANQIRQQTGRVAGAKAEAERQANLPTTGGGSDYLNAFTSGVTRAGRGMGNLFVKSLLASSIGPKPNESFTIDPRAPISDEAIAAQEQRDAPLEERPGGSLVRGVGEMVPLAPTMALSGGASALTRGAPALGRILTRALAGAGEGAIQGAATTAPGSGGAETGAGINSVLSLLGSGGSRVARGVVQKTPEAKNLIKFVEGAGGKLELPLVNAAEDEGLSGIFKTLYQHGLPNLPLASGALKRQQEEAAQTIRTALAKEATPTAAKGAVDLTGPAHDQLDHLRDAFNKEFDATINAYNIRVPDDLKERIRKKLIDSISPMDLAAGNTIPELVHSKMSAIVEGSVAAANDGLPTIGGRNLMRAKTLANESYPQLTSLERPHLSTAVRTLDDIAKEQIGETSAKDAARLADAQDHYSRLKILEKAAEKAKVNKGEYTFSDLLKEAEKDPEFERVARSGIESFDKRPLNPTWLGRMQLAGVPLAGGLLALTAGGPLGLAGAVAGGRTIAAKGVQRVLMGDTEKQKLIAKLLRKYPDRAAALGAFLRESAVVGEGNASR